MGLCPIALSRAVIIRGGQLTSGRSSYYKIPERRLSPYSFDDPILYPTDAFNVDNLLTCLYAPVI
jgi:hypothetical protein